MSAHELQRDHLTRYCLFGIDSASDINMLPTSVRQGRGDLTQSTMCSINSLARASDGNYYILTGNNERIPYKPKNGAVAVHICTSTEYDHETGMPTISNPEEGTFYLVPVEGSTGDLFAEWFWVNNAWERFGGGGVEFPQSDWNQTDNSASDYIKNKPDLSLKLDKNQGSGNSGKAMYVDSSGNVVPIFTKDLAVTETDLGNNYYAIDFDGYSYNSIVEVSGSNPVIVGVPNTCYLCGEVSTISISPPLNGPIEVFFTSGSSVAVLTLPSDVVMPEWWGGPEENRTYDIVITNGEYGSVMSWPA